MVQKTDSKEEYENIWNKPNHIDDRLGGVDNRESENILGLCSKIAGKRELFRFWITLRSWRSCRREERSL